jgi:hypothetical protein
VPDVSIVNQAVSAAPKDYLVPGSQEFRLKAVRAAMDGSATAASWWPALQMLDPSGNVMWTAIPNAVTAAAGSADVTWGPF